MGMYMILDDACFITHFKNCQPCGNTSLYSYVAIKHYLLHLMCMLYMKVTTVKLPHDN